MTERGYLPQPNVSDVLQHATIAAATTERRLVLPNDGITNGNFVADSNWGKGIGWTIGSGVATATGGISTDLAQSVGLLTVGRTYRIVYTITRTAGSITPVCGTTPGTARSANGTYTEDLLCAG